MKTLFKKYFVSGALVLIPVFGTLWIIKTLVVWIDNFFASFIPSTFYGNIPGLGLVLAIVLILVVGILTRLYVGKTLIAWGDRLIRRIPFGSSVYTALKQFLHTLASQESGTFKRVVLVEFPNPGVKMIGFITNVVLDGRVSVFIPTSPPTTGFLAMVEESKLIPLNISTEQAFKIIISAGAV